MEHSIMLYALDKWKCDSWFSFMQSQVGCSKRTEDRQLEVCAMLPNNNTHWFYCYLNTTKLCSTTKYSRLLRLLVFKLLFVYFHAPHFSWESSKVDCCFQNNVCTTSLCYCNLHNIFILLQNFIGSNKYAFLDESENAAD